MTTRTVLLAKLETAKKAISDAELVLQKAVADSAVAPRAEKSEVNEVVRAAFSKLSVAKAKLIELERLVTLAKIEAAKTTITEAQKVLDGVLDEMVVTAEAETTGVTPVVEHAFTKLRAAKRTLVQLEESLTTGED